MTVSEQISITENLRLLVYCIVLWVETFSIALCSAYSNKLKVPSVKLSTYEASCFQLFCSSSLEYPPRISHSETHNYIS